MRRHRGSSILGAKSATDPAGWSSRMDGTFTAADAAENRRCANWHFNRIERLSSALATDVPTNSV